MTAADNKRLLSKVFDHLANGEIRPFFDCLSDDVEWDMVGTTPWSGLYEGKKELQERLFGPLFAQFGDRYASRAVRILAEGDVVVVESRGRVTLETGKSYDNTYCYICEIADGKIRKVTEYLDTALVERALTPPEAA